MGQWLSLPMILGGAWLIATAKKGGAGGVAEGEPIAGDGERRLRECG
jgi:hypothetical protein